MADSSDAPAPNYWDYLKLDKLLDSQGGIDGDETRLMPDELHFIVVHQVYELWFKLTLNELRLARDHLAVPRVPEDRIPYVVHHLRRVGAILRLGVEQFAVVESLTPMDFLDFRDKLVPASGFQSFQLREIELVLGLEDAQRERYGKVDPLDHIAKLAKGSSAGDMARARLAGARAEQTLRSALHEWLYRTPIQGSTPDDPGDAEVVADFIAQYLRSGAAQRDKVKARLIAVGAADREGLDARFEAMATHAETFLTGADAADGVDVARVSRTRAAVLFIESYRELPLLAWPRLLLDTVLEVEEQLVIWRSRHARMVERTIGRRVGTGGSSGVDYLDKTAQYRIFPELWAVRTLLSPREALPALINQERYGFSS